MNENDNSTKKHSKSEAAAALWKKGTLWWKLNQTQKDLYDTVANTDKRVIVFLASRRLGKSFTLCLMAIEKCIRDKNVVVKYLCPDGKQAKTVIIPIIREILEDCPKALRPEWHKQDGKYVFPNGSEIQVAGNDAGRADSLRGGFAHLCIVDEAGFCDNLKYNVQSVLLPTVSTTGGKIVLSSTPPKSPGHDFTDHFIKRARYDGTFIKKTIFDNPRFSPAQIQEIIETYGDIEDPEFRREYLCELTVDLTNAIIPEFNNAATKKEAVQELVRPVFFDYYVAADIGFKDFTVVLFGYYDFRTSKIVVEDEIVINKMTTETLANAIRQKETQLLYNPLTGEQKVPYLRVSDNNLIVINDLHKLHSLQFVPTAKDDKEAAVNNTRILFNANRIVINPRCKVLIKHLEEGVWRKTSNGRARTFDRSNDNGHYDAIDALVYLVRNVITTKNPYPKGYGIQDPFNRFEYKNNSDANPAYQQLANMFKIKKSL